MQLASGFRALDTQKRAEDTTANIGRSLFEQHLDAIYDENCLSGAIKNGNEQGLRQRDEWFVLALYDGGIPERGYYVAPSSASERASSSLLSPWRHG